MSTCVRMSIGFVLGVVMTGFVAKYGAPFYPRKPMVHLQATRDDKTASFSPITHRYILCFRRRQGHTPMRSRHKRHAGTGTRQRQTDGHSGEI